MTTLALPFTQSGQGDRDRLGNHPNAGTLTITDDQMSAFLHGCKTGEFDDLTDG